MTEKRPIISTGGHGPASGGERRHIPMAARYAINAALVAVVLILGELLIGGGVITRYQSTVLEQVGVYIILAVSLNIATGYLGQLPLGHAGFMSVGAYGCAIFVMRMSEALGIVSKEDLVATIKDNTNARFLEMNLKAVDAGIDYAKEHNLYYKD